MSGYLQRLVAAANNAAPRVRPLLPTVFSRDTRTGEPVETQTEMSADSLLASQMAPPVGDASQVSAAHQMPGQASMRSVQPLSSPAAEASAVTNAPFQPLLPRRQSIASEESEEFVQRDAGERADERPSTGVPSATITMTKPLYVPLLPPQTQTQTNDSQREKASLPRAASPVAPIAAGAARPMMTRRTATAPPAKREPDEIQIHIGRIEVTAVSQAQPRTVSKPAHEGPSLSDYLKRRNRRA